MISYDKGEKTLYIARRHSIAFTLECLFLIVAAILPYIAFLNGLNQKLLTLFLYTHANPFLLKIALYDLWLLLIWILFFIAWNDYYLDAWIITDGRIIDVEQYGMFLRRINSYRLDQIKSVTVLEKSSMGKIFNYGSVELTLLDASDGPDEKFLIDEVAEPEKIKELVESGQANILGRLNKVVGKGRV